MSLKLQILVGSIRDGRVARPVADWIYEAAAKRDDFRAELIDLKEWDLPLLSFPKPPSLGDYEVPLQKKWAAKIAEGDAYLFVSPEYNHGYSPVLKNALDYLYAEWNRKPAAFASYGSVAGARSGEQLRQVLIELQMAPIRDAVHIDRVNDKIGDDGFAADHNDEKHLRKVLDELQWWAMALSKARRAAPRHEQHGRMRAHG